MLQGGHESAILTSRHLSADFPAVVLAKVRTSRPSFPLNINVQWWSLSGSQLHGDMIIVGNRGGKIGPKCSVMQRPLWQEIRSGNATAEQSPMIHLHHPDACDFGEEFAGAPGIVVDWSFYYANQCLYLPKLIWRLGVIIVVNPYGSMNFLIYRGYIVRVCGCHEYLC